ncbi:MAG: hypothetical protein K2Y21_12330 [Phycisphaerales bacterium]|nr:hypothetical protein [Phycisphaerales bacterium]
MNNKNPSLLEGLNLPESMTGKPAPARRDLGASIPSLQYADWTPTQKKVAAGGLAVVAIAMLVGGAWLTRQWMPPSMPKTFADGAAVIATGRINNLDETRRGDFYRELARMWPSLSEEERNKWRSDPAYEKMMEQIREQAMDDTAKKIARGEEKLPEWGPPPGPRPEPKPEDKPKDAGGKPQSAQPGGGGGGGGGGNGRAGRNSEQRRQMIVNRISNSIMNRNAQSNGLRGEMMRGGQRGGGGAPARK